MLFQIIGATHVDLTDDNFGENIPNQKFTDHKILTILTSKKYTDSNGNPYTAEKLQKKLKRVGIKNRYYARQDHVRLGMKVVDNIVQQYGEDILSTLDSIIVSSCTNLNPNRSISKELIEAINDEYKTNISLGIDVNAACSGVLATINSLNKIITENQVLKTSNETHNPELLFGSNTDVQNSIERLHRFISENKTGIRNVLVLSIEKMSSLIEYTSPTTSLLFGDATTGTLLSYNQNNLDKTGVQGSVILYEDKDNISCTYPDKNGDIDFHMKGRSVYEEATRLIPEMITKYLKEKKLNLNDFDHIVPHQANKEMIETILKSLGIQKESKKAHYTIENHGNTASATIPLTLSIHKSQFKPGDRILTFAIGAGMILSLVDIIRSEQLQEVN